MIEVLANDVTPEGYRHLKVVSDIAPVPYPIPAGSIAQTWQDELLGLNYLVATWPCREPVRIVLEGQTEGYECVLWKLKTGERVSEVLKEMIGLFCERFKSFPGYAFMRKLPKGIECGFEVDDVMLFEAGWVPPGCIVVSNGG